MTSRTRGLFDKSSGPLTFSTRLHRGRLKFQYSFVDLFRQNRVQTAFCFLTHEHVFFSNSFPEFLSNLRCSTRHIFFYPSLGFVANVSCNLNLILRSLFVLSDHRCKWRSSLFFQLFSKRHFFRKYFINKLYINEFQAI